MKDHAFQPAKMSNQNPIGKAKIPRPETFKKPIEKGPSEPIARSGKVAKK